MAYRWHAGYIAWLLNRITGLAITLYLAVHIWVMHHLAKGKESFDGIMEFIQSPITLIFEVLLIGAVLYHGINGARIMIIEFFDGSKHQKSLFVGTLVMAGVLFLWTAVVAFSHISTPH